MSVGKQNLQETLEEEIQEFDRLDLSSTDMSTSQFSYEQDFCLTIAQVAATEYTPTAEIKQIIQKMMNEKRKTALISLILQLFNLVCKNHFLITQLRSTFEAYKKQAEEQGYKNRFEIEKNCIKIFEKKPSALALISQIHKEFYSLFNEMQDKEFSEIVTIFLRGEFIKSIFKSTEHIMRYPEAVSQEISRSNEDINEDIVTVAQYINTAIDCIRHALELVFKARHYAVLTNSPVQITKEKQTQPEVFEVDKFLIAYLRKILTEKESKEECFEGGNFFKDQLIRIPKLIQAMKKVLEKNSEKSWWFASPEVIETPEKSELKRNALSMIRQVTAKSSSLNVELDGENDLLTFQDTKEKMLITSTRWSRRSCCKPKFTQHEEFAALLDRIPLVESMNDAGAIRASALKFLKLYPGTIETLGPHLIWMELAANVMGGVSATDAILNPKKNRLSIRIWKATTNGIVFFVFGLGAAINIYLWYHPNDQNISDELFFKEIASAPLGLMLLHTCWHTIPALQKEILFPRKTRYFALRLGLDLGFKTLYNAGIFLFAGMTFFNLPKTLIFQLLPIIPGIFVSLGQLFSPFREKLITGMTYLTFAIFSSNVVKSYSPSSSDRSFEGNLQLILRTVMLTGLSLYSCGLLAKRYLYFLNEYINEDIQAAEIIARRIYLPVVDGEADDSLYRDQGTIIDMQAYHTLSEDVKQGRMDAAHQKTLLFSSKAKESRGLSNTDARHEINENEAEPRKSVCNRCVIL